jgi:catechol 2,3-dioxygenase-like lactoylglutathione lyase family enzyme
MTDMPATKAIALAYIRMQVADLDASCRFFKRFGLIVREQTSDALYLAGTGSEHHLLILHQGAPAIRSTAFEVAEMRDLVDVSAGVPGASPVEAMADAAGGHRVTIPDPDGNVIELVHGLATCAPLAVAAIAEFNTAGNPVRRRNAIVRPEAQPSRVLRLGHIVFKTPDVEALVRWYGDTLGLLASDDVLSDDGNELIMSFVRLDRGAEFVDHHVMQFIAGAANHIHHISFEVQDIDDLYMGHAALSSEGYQHVWGIGRHLQGSQIFDYWLDPNGVMYEHWTDSDRFDAGVPKGVVSAHEMAGPWGPAMPEAFIQQAFR